jgi:hypothetical protein
MKKLIIVIALLLIFGILFVYPKTPKTTARFITNRTFERSEDAFFTREIVMYPSNVKIISPDNPSNLDIGIVGDPWNLNFGVLPVGVNGKRFVNVANYREITSKVKLVCYGDICSKVTFDKNNLILHEGDEEKITVTLNASSSVPGEYSGEIHIVSDIPKTPVISDLLGWK